MQYERRVVDAKKKIVQITTTDERWYSQEIDGELKYLPSTTWVTSYYPKGKGFEKYLLGHTKEEADELLIAAGIKGSFSHAGVEYILNGGVLRFDTVLEAQGIKRELTVEEYENVMSFVQWFDEVKPKTISTEQTVFCDTHAGTIDYVCEIDGEPYIIDFKTGGIYVSYECQLTAYRIALGIEANLAILQLGYKYNKFKKYKFTPVQFQPDLWWATYKIWQKECAGIKPLQRDYPLELKLNQGEKTNETTKNRKQNI